MNIDITDEDIYKIEEKVSIGRGAWDMTDHRELVKACVVVFFEKMIKQLEAQ